MNKKFWVGALVGCTAGAAAGLLMAPRCGEETRKLIAKKFSRKKKPE